MKLLDLIRAREICRTNGLGAKTEFAIGNVVTVEDTTYRVTRHHVYATAPWATIVIYAVPT